MLIFLIFALSKINYARTLMSILNKENLKLEALNLSQKYQKTAFWQRGWG
jgi:hypothetical protein